MRSPKSLTKRKVYGLLGGVLFYFENIKWSFSFNLSCVSCFSCLSFLLFARRIA